ncbi:MAG: AAA domain-containing protein, partial [Rickettsiales bacterium]|nr:AAA domain-containing protein [Rickettsiales bacterium]
MECIKAEDMNVSLSGTGKTQNIFKYLDTPNFPVISFDLSSQLKNFITRYSNYQMCIGYPCYREKDSVKPIIIYNIDIHDDKLEVNYSTPILNFSGINDLFLTDFPKTYLDNFDNDFSRIKTFEEIKNFFSQIFLEMAWIPSQNISENKENKEKHCILDQAIIFPKDAFNSSYTIGLKKELELLSKKEIKDIQNTALYKVLMANSLESANQEVYSLLEVSQLNKEQKQAILTSFNSNVSVVTGPPGTGKSQFITNLLINSVLQGKRILFTSKNNKAVDVVEDRINKITDRPVLLRQGSNQYITALKEFVEKLLQQIPTEKDLQDYKLYEQSYKQKEILEDNIYKNIDEVINLRNIIDKQEQSVETFRINHKNLFEKLKNDDCSVYISQIRELKEYELLIDIDNRSIFFKLIWYFFKYSLTKKFNKYIEKLSNVCRNLMVDFDMKYIYFEKDNIEYYKNKIAELVNLQKNIEIYRIYFDSLEKLNTQKQLSVLYKELEKCHSEKIAIAKDKLNLYLKLQTYNISQQDRINIANALADIKKIIEDQSFSVPHEKLTPILKFLPCWAVTTLSAHGKIPFEAGFFDYVVFDEAGQCDIASALPLLYRAKHAIIVGDPQQLPHITNLTNVINNKLIAEYEISKNSRFDYRISSLYDIVFPILPQQNVTTLVEHYRCHNDIVDFSNKYFYNNKLRIATNTNRLNTVSGYNTNILWENIEGETIKPKNGGALNEKEANQVIQILEDILCKKQYNGSIGVITPFRVQANHIRQLAFNNQKIRELMSSSQLLIDTTHKFQGDE